MESKVIRKYFGLAYFIEEQEFLQEQHRNGWRFKRLEGLSKYTFEKCEPAEYIYQLDYKENDKDEESYIQMFKDYGWEYIMKYHTWYYFAKEKSDNEADNRIFSDAESKLAMCGKIFLRQGLLIPLPLIAVWCCFNRAGSEVPILKALEFIPLIAGICMTGAAIKNLVKLRKTMYRLKNPIR